MYKQITALQRTKLTLDLLYEWKTTDERSRGGTRGLHCYQIKGTLVVVVVVVVVV